MDSDAGHAVVMNIRCRPNTDIPLLELVATPLQGQVFLHNLLNASKLVVSPVTTIQFSKQGIYQEMTFPQSIYRAKIFHTSVMSIDPDSFS